MITRTEGGFRGHHGIDLFYQSWSPEKPRGTLVVTHGMSEHSECYDRLAQAVVPRGWAMYAWDLRGHGRSEGKRGFVDDFHHYVLDLGLFLQKLKDDGRFGDRPFALLGHSMGGLITLRHLVDNGAQGATAGVLSSPLLGFSLAVPMIKDVAARLLHKVMPSLTLYNEIRRDHLSRDTKIISTYDQDPFRHEKISPNIYLGMIANFEYVSARADMLRLPLFFQVAGRDRIVSRQATEAFCNNIGHDVCRVRIYEDSYHEIYNDLNREEVYADLNAYLEEQMGSGAGATTSRGASTAAGGGAPKPARKKTSASRAARKPTEAKE